jgi:hypothetical protein
MGWIGKDGKCLSLSYNILLRFLVAIIPGKTSARGVKSNFMLNDDEAEDGVWIVLSELLSDCVGGMVGFSRSGDDDDFTLLILTDEKLALEAVLPTKPRSST